MPGMPGMPGPGPGRRDPKKPDSDKPKPAPKPERKAIDQMVGDILLVSVLRSAHKFEFPQRACELHDRTAMELAIIRVSLALSAYRAGSGRYPRDLSLLSPRFIRRVPVDLFVNRPLRYKGSRSGYLLYSVGLNMTDDGGRNDRTTRDDDIGVRVR